MKNFKLPLIIVLVFLMESLHATTYYIDASNGNDSNNGTSPATAWQSIPKVVGMAPNFQPGDSILFKRGEIWSGERLNTSSHASGTINNPITYSSYGTGAKPIITIHRIQNPTWTNEGNNTWSTITQTGSRYFRNGVELLRAVDSTHLGLYGTSFYDACYNGCSKLKLYVYSSTNPALDTFAWSSGSYTIGFKYANYINLIDLDFQGGASSSIRLYNNIGWKVLNCTVGKYAGSGIKMRYASNMLIDSVVLNSYFTVDMSQLPVGTSDYTGCSDGIFVSTGSSNIIVRNCFFKNWEHASFSSNSKDSTNIVSNIKFYNNELTAPDILHGGRLGYSGYCEDGEFYNNYIHNTRATNQLGGSRNHFHHNIIDSVLHSPIEYYVYALGVSLSNYNVQIKDNIIENNVIANTDGKGMEIYSINFDYPGEMSGNILRNNILFNCGTLVNDVAVQFHEDSAGQLIYNNLMVNNLIYNSNTSQTCLYMYSGILSNVDTFNTQNSNIHDNISSNPLFVNAAIGDYHLTASSPAIDAGTAALATHDYNGNLIPNGLATDIGAFEYYSSIGFEDNLENDIIVYPNPFTDKVFFSDELLNTDYQIISISGALLKSGKITSNEINLSALASGIYFMQITDNKSHQRKTFKLIKR